MSATPLTFTVNVRQEFDGTYIAEVPQLPGCFAGGDSVESAVKVLCEVLPSYLEDVRGLPHMTVTDVELREVPKAEQVVARRELVLA